jgi:hypothetical protein
MSFAALVRQTIDEKLAADERRQSSEKEGAQ